MLLESNSSMINLNCSEVDPLRDPNLCSSSIDLWSLGIVFGGFILGCFFVPCMRPRDRNNADQNRGQQNPLQQGLLPATYLGDANEASQSINMDDQNENELSQSRHSEKSKTYSINSEVELSEIRTDNLILEQNEIANSQLISTHTNQLNMNPPLLYNYANNRGAIAKQQPLTPPIAKRIRSYRTRSF